MFEASCDLQQSGIMPLTLIRQLMRQVLSNFRSYWTTALCILMITTAHKCHRTTLRSSGNKLSARRSMNDILESKSNSKIDDYAKPNDAEDPDADMQGNEPSERKGLFSLGAQPPYACTNHKFLPLLTQKRFIDLVLHRCLVGIEPDAWHSTTPQVLPNLVRWLCEEGDITNGWTKLSSSVHDLADSFWCWCSAFMSFSTATCWLMQVGTSTVLGMAGLQRASRHDGTYALGLFFPVSASGDLVAGGERKAWGVEHVDVINPDDVVDVLALAGLSAGGRLNIRKSTVLSAFIVSFRRCGHVRGWIRRQCTGPSWCCVDFFQLRWARSFDGVSRLFLYGVRRWSVFKIFVSANTNRSWALSGRNVYVIVLYVCAKQMLQNRASSIKATVAACRGVSAEAGDRAQLTDVIMLLWHSFPPLFWMGAALLDNATRFPPPGVYLTV